MRSMDDFLRRSTALVRESIAAALPPRSGGGEGPGPPGDEPAAVAAARAARVSSELREGVQNDRALFDMYSQRKAQESSPGRSPDGSIESPLALASVERPRKVVSISPEEG